MLEALLASPAGHSGHQVVSGVMGSISIAFWLLVFTPQIYENYKRRSSEGLSTSFIVIWLVGDFFNVVGALLQHVLPTMIILAAYYTIADIVLLIQCIAYHDNTSTSDEESIEASETTSLLSSPAESTHKEAIKNTFIVLSVAFAGVIGYIISSHYGNGDSNPGEQEFNFWGQVLGWICAVLYLASRVPQIKLNYDRKSTDGISLLFFIFAVLGNVTYIISILAADASVHALLVNASWLAGSVGTLFLDFVIFGQFMVYRR